MSKQLYRSRTKKMIAGVCGGLADYFDIDISLVRLIFVGISLVTAIIPMLIFYVIAWIILPVEEREKA